MMILRTLLFTLLASYSILSSAEALHIEKLSQSVIQAHIEKVVDKNPEREAALKQMFADAGCTGHLNENPVAHEKLPNVVCVLPGKSAREIIIGAHFDKVEAGHGAADNWSGAAMLPALFESLRSDQREHTLVFIGFAAEEKGLIGSRDYVHKLKPEDRQRISAMINLDTLGLGPTVIWLSHADVKLAELLTQTANSLKLPLGAVNVDSVGSSDSESFRDAKIPAMTVHSLTQETLSILHSKSDTLAAIKQNDYYDTYRLLAFYLAYIDRKLDAPEPVATPGKAK